MFNITTQNVDVFWRQQCTDLWTRGRLRASGNWRKESPSSKLGRRPKGFAKAIAEAGLTISL
jgi:hypothetical protein